MSEIHHEIAKDVIFVHSMLDDAGLSANEFRVYCHLARRAGANGAFPSADSIAEVCRINKDTAWKALKTMGERKMIRKIARPGTSNIYVLTRQSEWIEAAETEGRRNTGGGGNEGVGGGGNEGVGGGGNKGARRESIEGNPLKEIQSSVGTRFVDEWNEAAKTSGLAKIKEWTTKRDNKLKALARVYKADFQQNASLAIGECHKNDWCIANKANVDHLLVADNFQRYLDKARTAATAPKEVQTGQTSSAPAGGREELPWDKKRRLQAEGCRRRIEDLKKARRRAVAERGEQTLDVHEIDQAIRKLETEILSLGHEP